MSQKEELDEVLSDSHGSDPPREDTEPLHGGLALGTVSTPEQLEELSRVLQTESLVNVAAQKIFPDVIIVDYVAEQTDRLSTGFDLLAEQIDVANEGLEAFRQAGKVVSKKDVDEIVKAVDLIKSVPVVMGMWAVQKLHAEGDKQTEIDRVQGFLTRQGLESLEEAEAKLEELKLNTSERHSPSTPMKPVRKSHWDAVEQALRPREHAQTEKRSTMTKPLPMEKDDATQLSKALKPPKPYSGKTKAEFDRYVKYFKVYTAANNVSEPNKKLLMEMNLPATMQSHWQLLKEECSEFEEMVTRMASVMGLTTEHARCSQKFQLFTLKRISGESYAKFCERAEELATEVFADDYNQRNQTLKVILVGAMEADSDKRYISAAMTSLEHHGYAQLKEQVLTMERTWRMRPSATVPWQTNSRSVDGKQPQGEQSKQYHSEGPKPPAVTTKKTNATQCRTCGGLGHWMHMCPNNRSSQPRVNAVIHRTQEDELNTLLSHLPQQNSIDPVCAEIAPATGSEPTFGEPLRDEVDVGSKTVTALLDTGAATTVIRMDILIEILKNNTAAKGITRLTRQEAGLAAVNGDALNVKGWILMELRAKGANKTKAVVAIIEHMNHEMVIGMNILRYERQWWYRLQSLWKKAYKSKRPALFDATVDQTITVFGETSATMAIRTPIVHTLALIDSRVEQIESGIIKSRNGRAFVQVNNKDTKEITFRVGDTIGEVWPAEIVKDVAELDNADVIAGVESWDDTARRAELKARLNIQKSELSENLKAELEKKILDEYASVFAVYENEHGRTDLVTHTIDTHESAPIKIPNRPVPIPLKEKVWTAIKELIEAEVVEESQSPWSSPVVLAKKKDGELRICVDYRRLNSVTKKDAYPLPSQDSMMFQLKGMKIFSTMDFYSGYYQIPLDSESREKTAFSVLGRLYQFTVLPMGLTTSPACFLRLMEKVLGDLVGSSLFVYMDDILVYSTSEEEHVQVLEEVFRRLKDAGLRLKPSKCAFGRKQVAFLGHLITEEGIKIDADRVAAIQAIPQPKSVTEVRSFLGMAAYVRQFISNFSKRAAPLHELTKKQGGPFVWTKEADKAFQELKQSLSTTPVLKQPDFEAATRGNRPFVIYTDASKTGVGAVLTQEDETGKIHPIYFIAKKCSESEQNYSVLQLEALAIVVAVRRLRMFIMGANVIVRTDHQPLLAMFKEQNSAQLVRWKLELQAYAGLRIEFVKGKANVVADALSRLPHTIDQGSHTEVLEAAIMVVEAMPTNDTEWEAAFGKDPDYAQLKRDANTEDGIELKGHKYVSKGSRLWRIDKNGQELQVVPQVFRKALFDEKHSSALAGHFGAKKTLKMLEEKYYWPTMKADVVLWARSCQKCFVFRSHKRERPPLIPFEESEPFQTVGIDLMDMPLSINGYKYVLVIVDHFSKFAMAVALRYKTAEQAADGLMTSFLKECQFPERIISDLGREFDNEVMRCLAEWIGVELRFTMGYNSKFNGAAERVIQTLRRTIAKKMGPQDEWDKMLPYAVYAYNTVPHEATNETPVFLTRGRQPLVPSAIDCEREISPMITIDDYKTELTTRIAATAKEVRERLEEYRQAMADQYNSRTHARESEIATDDLVYIELHRETSKNPRKKLAPRWTGPARVKSVGKTHVEVVFLGRRGVQSVPLSQVIKCPPELRDCPPVETHTRREGKRKPMISVMDFSVCAPTTMTSTSSILDAFRCDCRRPSVNDALPGLGDERDFKPDTVTDYGRLITAKVSTTLSEEERRNATHQQDAARRLVPHVPVKWLVPAYHQSMMTCRHLRRTLEDVVKKPELLVGREEEVKALRKAVAQLHGIPFHHHDDKRTLVIGGRNAAMLAKVSGEYRVIGAEGIHELVNCVVSETFTHAIVWPEQNWWLELGSASMKMAEKACRMLKFWNSFLEVSLMPPLSEDSHVTVWNKLERAYLSENSKFFRGKELLRESEVTCPRGIDVNKNGVLTDAGAGRIWRCLEKLGAVATSPQDVRVVVARRAASPKKTVSSVVTVPRPEQWSLDLVERQRDRRENRHRRPSRYERD